MIFLNSLFLKCKIIFYILLFISIKLTINTDPECAGCKAINNKCVFKDACQNIGPITDECKCNENCRAHLYEDGDEKCYDCTEAFRSSNSKLYTIEDEICKLKSISDCNKIIIESNECVSDCSPGYEFGDYCYSSCDENLGIEPDASSSQKCKCKEDHYYIEEEIPQNKKYLRCTKTCPSGYYNYNTKFCIKNIQNCEGDLDKIIDNNGCTDSCNDHNKFLYYETETINGNIITKQYCLDECPNQKKFYYENNLPFGEKICLPQCNVGDFYNEQGECLSDCNNMALIDVSANIYKCTNISIPNSSSDYKCAETEFPYQYKNYCLKNCYDTQNLEFFGKITKTYILNIRDENDIITKTFCSEDCTEEGNQPYFNSITLSCHQDCKETSYKFNFANECINSCTELQNFQLYLFDTNRCVSDCEGYGVNVEEYRLSRKEKICYKNYCQDSEYYKYIDESNECNTCNIPKNPNKIENGEGYIFEEHIGDKVVLKCLKYCSKKTIIEEEEEESETKLYHNDNDNLCLDITEEEGCENNNGYSYYIGKTSEIDYICYKSCKDIPGNYIYQYGFKCFKEPPEETGFSNFYYIESGIYTYIKEENNVVEICSKRGLNYFKNGNEYECVKECNEGEYKILYSTDQNGKIERLGKCLRICPTTESLNIFYSVNEKICYENCPYKAVLKKQDDGNYEPITEEENCVINCPQKYPFESKDGKNCYDICPNKFYIEMNGKKICVDNCGNKYYFDGEFKCLDKCEKKINDDIFYYYYKTNHICIEKCNIEDNNENDEDKKLKYAFETLQNHQPCIEECPDGYFYFENDKLCINECKNGFIEEIGSNKCVLACGEGKYINGTICSDECTKEQPFYYPITIGAITMNKCTSNCEKEENSPYKYFKKSADNDFYECLPFCTNVIYDKECRENCPEGLYEENNICVPKCINKKYYKKKEDGSYKCLDDCKESASDTNTYYITSNNECRLACPFGQNFIGVGNKCKSFCSKEDGEYFIKIGSIEEISYSIYKCVEKCNEPNQYILDGTKECINYPEDNTYYKLEKEEGIFLYSICLKNDKQSFSYTSTDETIKECRESCPNDNKKYYGKDKICSDNCDNYEIENIMNEKDYSCVSKCDYNSDYKYLYTDENDKKYCKDNCLDKKYSINDYICVDYCQEPYNYLINGEICSDKCQNGQFAQINTNNEYICQDRCDPGFYYYENEKICLQNCSPGYNIQYSNKCVESCTETIQYYYYEPKDDNSPFTINTCVTECPLDKPFRDINNTCNDVCKFIGYQYYKPSDKICLPQCPDGYVKNGNECLLSCPQEDDDKKFWDETNTCIESCLDSKAGYKFYYSSDKKCIKKCKENDFIYNDNECKKTCPDDAKYIYNNHCVNYCHSEQKYFIGNFEHGETDLNNYCLTDCWPDYPFFTIESDESRKCSGSCENYYISNKDPNINAKQCVPNCDNGYTFFVKYNDTHKECFETCPNGNRYYIKSNEAVKECFEKCPSTHPYHNINSFECIDDCESKHATYNEKECVSNCEINSFWIKEENKDITLCVQNCTTEIEYSRFYTPDRECVNKCNETKFLRGNIKENICECMNLFYYNDDDILECFDNAIQKCGEKGTIAENYPIQIDKTNECIQNCFGILSPSEDICYTNTENFKCPQNTQKGIYNGKIKCECKYKYYFDSNNKKICLNETEKCPSDYNYFIPDKNQCTINCNDYPIIFDNNCLNRCPGSMKPTDDNKSCKCEKNWYKTIEDKYICLSKDEVCNNEYPYLIEETSECVEKCDKTNYEIFYDNKCISSCGDKMTRVVVEEDYPTYNISKYTCRCNYIWGEGICSNSSVTSCEDLGKSDLKYLVKKTKECVKNCPNYYPYYFNDECFSTCDEAKYYGYNVKKKDDTSKECICEVYFRINVDNNKIECIDECNDEEILIDDTKQCIKIEGEEEDNNFKCPYSSPYLYNKKCYTKCPDGTKIDTIKGNACTCEKLWITQENGLVYCIEDEKCPRNTHPFLIDETKECVKTKDDCDDKKLFNYTCYNNCPYLTKESNDNDNDNDCECNNNYYWYKYKNPSDNNREYLVCGLEKCPDEKPYINGTNECINTCGDEGLYEYAKICYSECPLFTTKNENDYICEFSTESNDLENLVGNVTNIITDIYDNLPDGGLVINNEEASLQIYGLNKDKKTKKDLIIRSNLAYIDLSGCIKKIYESNDIDSSEDIVVVKLDLKSKNKKLIVNPIEYQFINSKNGKVLDASVCEKNEVVISYPITYILKKLRNLEDEEENEEEIKKEILDKFNKGKELNLIDKSFDTFNFNSSIYSDICTSIQVDGKDLVLEDRIQYLFPNYSFCESICTYDYTDFEGERIYCNCSIKSEIDIGREHGIKIYQINKNETENNQKGPTNIPVLKCISKAKIAGNGAFYYCLIFILIEIALLIVVILYGIPGLIDKIKRKTINNKDEDKNKYNNIVYNNSENDKMKETKNDKTFKYKNDNNDNDSNTKRKIKSNEKKIKSNPPKIKNKNGDITDEIEDEKDIEGVITIKKQNNKPIELKEKNIKIDEKNNYEDLSEGEHNESEMNKYLQKNGIDTQMGFYQSMKQEEKLLRTKYIYSLQNDNFDSIIVVLTSVFDKIYLIKVLLLPAKFDIIPLMFSLYLLCHMILLTFLTFFYDIKTLQKIYQNNDYPNINYYLLYGFIANIIVWIIFKLFYCLLNNEHKTKKIININDKDKKNDKYNKIIYKIKRNMIIYLALQFLIILFCSFYLITFCGIYIGTKKLIFQSYGIAIVEIIIIKIIYGFILGILRKVSLYKEYNILYKIVLIFNKYIS